MIVEIIGKQHREGVSQKTGKEYNFNCGVLLLNPFTNFQSVSWRRYSFRCSGYLAAAEGFASL